MLGAQTQGMIGYWLVQSLENALPDLPVAGLVCRTVVDGHDPAFGSPSKFVGPVYADEEAHALAAERGWQIALDGERWRRVVASPEPRRICELPIVERLLSSGVIVVCAGGGGIPVVPDASGRLHGVEAVIDKDLTAAMLAIELHADALVLLTDVASVELGHGTDQARPIGRAGVAYLRSQTFPAGSMGPKVEAACRFVEATGNLAAIGRLADAARLAHGATGTVVTPGPRPESEAAGTGTGAKAPSRAGLRVVPTA